MSLAPDNLFRAIGLKLAAVFLFVVMASFIKAASGEVPPGEAVFFRSFFALPVIVIWLITRSELRTGLKTKRPWMHATRALMGTAGMGLGFAGLALLPLSEVQAIQYVVPVFVVILAALFLGETVRFVRMTAVVLGLIGVLIILWPRLTAFSGSVADTLLAIGALFVLAGSLFKAFTQVFIRKMVETEETAAIVFWFSVCASVLGVLTLPFGWAWPSPVAAAFLIGAGLIGGVAQIVVTSAYRYGDASVIAPFDYASMLFALAIGYVAFAEVPTVQMLAGAALVIASGVLIILRERYLGLKRGKAQQHVPK